LIIHDISEETKHSPLNLTHKLLEEYYQRVLGNNAFKAKLIDYELAGFSQELLQAP
jgi:hypothetical protein